MKTLYYNGTILTMEDSLKKAEAVYVEDGIIQAVGSNEDLLKYHDESVEVVDLAGTVMLPGFIDSHSHFVAFANTLVQCDLSTATCFEDIKTLLQQFIVEKSIQPGKWVVGFNYDHNFLDEKTHPTRELLDEVSNEHPIIIIHASSHMGVVNTLALKEANMTDQSISLEDHKYGRFEDGKLNGYMEEEAFTQFRTHIPMMSSEQLLDLMVQAQDIYASNGITTIQEGFVNDQLFELLCYASQSKKLKLDVMMYIDLQNSRELYKNNTTAIFKHLKVGGYKIFLDGSPQGKTAWLMEPYEGETSYCGYPTYDDETLQQLIYTALSDDAQLLAHCNGDQAAKQYVDNFKLVVDKYNFHNTHRPVMIHAQMVREEQLKQMKQLDMIPSFFVDHVYYWGDIHIKNLGLERASRISPLKDAILNHILFTLHQDTPVIQPNMIRTLYNATNRLTKNGVELGKDQCITIEQALKAITINGAYQYHEENVKGSIKVGKQADFVILNQNPLELKPSDLLELKVLATIKNNEFIFRS